jgi:peptidoglycan hydrolase-like protein with peptidoglycan-binding domain
VIELLSHAPRRRRKARAALWAAGALLLLCGIAAGVALLAWPPVRLAPDGEALARVVQPGYAGQVSRVVVRSSDGSMLPVALRDGRLWPTRGVQVGELVTVELTVRRPGWAGWLVGRTAQRSFRVRAPRAGLRDRWLDVRPGVPVTVSFDRPVRVVVLDLAGRHRTVRFTPAQATVRIGVVARGPHVAGSVTVSAAPRAWEQLPAPVRVSWFPVRKHSQALVEPMPGSTLAPGQPITVTFSQTVRKAVGASLPTITPSVRGGWQVLDSHTISFVPSGLGYPFGARLNVHLPAVVGIEEPTGARIARRLSWTVAGGSTLRLQQLLALAGYLPLDWRPSAISPPLSERAQVLAAISPPSGRFSWRYPNTPPELQALWRAGQPNEITRGAVMMFEDTHSLTADGFAGTKVWRALLSDAIAGRPRRGGYSYVFVHRSLPQSLSLWHNGRTILSSPGNTGIPAAPTQLGSFPVFEHIASGTMSGTNPDGTHYNDPGIRYISYFNHGDAIHAFNRASFGTPQSLGCVELPLAAAARVWPYTPIGTLVTIEN